MIDTAKIINALENCVHYSGDCVNCEYLKHTACKTCLMIDALAVLKEQEPRVMTRLEVEQSKGRIVWFEDDQFNSYALVDGIDQRNGWVWLSTAGNMGLQQRRDCENYGKKWIKQIIEFYLTPLRTIRFIKIMRIMITKKMKNLII